MGDMTERGVMQIRERQEGPCPVLEVTGRMVLTEGEGDNALRDLVLERAGDAAGAVIVNLAGVTQMDTSGLKQLLSAHLALNRRGGHLLLAAPSKRIRDLLAVTRLNTLFHVFESDAAALESLSTRA